MVNFGRMIGDFPENRLSNMFKFSKEENSFGKMKTN